MNKALRQEITKRKHIQRCKALGIIPEKHYCYKAQGKPCSCTACSPKKYSRKVKHKEEVKEVVVEWKTLECRNIKPCCSPNLKHGVLICDDCDWSELDK